MISRAVQRSMLAVALSACTIAPSDDKAPPPDTLASGIVHPDPVAVADTIVADIVVAVSPIMLDSAQRDSVVTELPLPPAAESLDDELRVFGASLMIPVQGVALSELRDTYGDPRTGHMHGALDIMAPRGTPVLSATAGRLHKLFTSVQGGTMVYAGDPSDRFILMYSHLDRYADGLVEGMALTRGQLLGYVGSTGSASATAPHLHFALARGQPSVAWWKGEAVNPYPLFVQPAVRRKNP